MTDRGFQNLVERRSKPGRCPEICRNGWLIHFSLLLEDREIFIDRCYSCVTTGKRMELFEELRESFRNAPLEV